MTFVYFRNFSKYFKDYFSFARNKIRIFIVILNTSVTIGAIKLFNIVFSIPMRVFDLSPTIFDFDKLEINHDIIQLDFTLMN